MTPLHGELGLIERLRQGDATALESLMEEYAPRVYRVVRGITRDAADAEEVVQDVFLKLFNKIDSFEGRAALSTWIYRIAVNTALLRRRGKRLELETLIEDELPQFLDDGHREGDRAWLLVDWSPLPDEVLLTGEARRALDRALDQLPGHYRAVLVMRDVEGLSNDEVALVLQEPVPAIKSRLHRARMVLREQLTGYFGARPAGGPAVQTV